MDIRERCKLVAELEGMVKSIENAEIFGFTMQLLNVAPKSFWTRPSSRNHHPEDERGEYGDIIHTIRVVKTADILCHIPNIIGISRDMVISAASTHDLCRYGLDDESDHTVPEHAQLVRQLAKRHDITCEYSEPIFKMVEGHMGRWGINACTPYLNGKAIIHIADAICARIAEVLNKEEW